MPRIVCISDTHGFYQKVERESGAYRRVMTEVIYLKDSAVDILGLRIYGSPWQPAFNDWAFNLARGEALAKVWAKIP